MQIGEPVRQYSFPWQKKDEVVQMVMRAFLPALIVPVITISGITFIPIFVLSFLLERMQLMYQYSELSNTVFLLWMGAGVLWIIYLWYQWFFDISVVTNIRIVDIDQIGFFHQKVSEAGLDKIQDVVYEVRGILQTIFDFGNITIFTAGSRDGFTFENIHTPHTVHKRLLALIETHASTQEKPLTPRQLLEYLQNRDSLLAQNLTSQPSVEEHETSF
ncbi:MAG: PH domain-containing protein [bacterium]